MTNPTGAQAPVHDKYPSRIADKPQWQDRQDPVVHSTRAEGSPLTKAQAEQYERDGYLLLEGFFDEVEVERLRGELDRQLELHRGSTADEVIREPGGDEVRSIFAVHRNIPVFKALAEDERLQAIVQFLLGSEVYVHQSRINFKPGFTGKEFYWHSDFETWHVEDGMPAMRALSCSIALTDNYPFNGPLMVMPGSHKTFVSCVGRTPENHFKQSLRRQEYGVPDPDSLTELARRHGIDMPVGRAGSIVLFDCNIMHGSNSNITPYARSNVFMVYNSVHNKLTAPFSGQQPRPPYIAERG